MRIAAGSLLIIGGVVMGGIAGVAYGSLSHSKVGRPPPFLPGPGICPYGRNHVKWSRTGWRDSGAEA